MIIVRLLEHLNVSQPMILKLEGKDLGGIYRISLTSSRMSTKVFKGFGFLGLCFGDALVQLLEVSLFSRLALEHQPASRELPRKCYTLRQWRSFPRN